MVDLVGQYHNIKSEIDTAIQNVLDSAHFIKGPPVLSFEEKLAEYLEVKHVISCANGTDALQVALMALNLDEGDEVILPAFTYPATVEVVALLKLRPVLVDVDKDTFNISIPGITDAISEKTKVIVPVHLFGQCADLESIKNIAQKHNIKIIEDSAQSIGTTFTFSDGSKKKAGSIGDIGTTSFFPTKNLGCFGDGGAIFTDDDELAVRIRMICNHGQVKKYHHSIIGVNSRLDTIQAAVLETKLKHLDKYIQIKQDIALKYDEAFSQNDSILIPSRVINSTHSFHQYTIKVKDELRDPLKQYLYSKGIPSMVYYPLPIHEQEAYTAIVKQTGALENSKQLCKEVISLPIHTELKVANQKYIFNTINNFIT